MYDEIFLPGIIREIQSLDRSMYHLDGPGARRHLDSLLAIPDLDAVQWVHGTGNEGFARWASTCQRIQAAGKALYFYCQVDEVEQVIDTLDPHGLCVYVLDVPDRETGEAIVRSFEKWGLRTRG